MPLDMLSRAVILVGGPGTRLRPLTYVVPKAMVPVLNRPFLEHTIAYLGKYGVSDIVLALNYMPDAIREHFGDGSACRTNLAYCIEAEPLGTAGAVKNAESYLEGTFVVLNGDVFSEIDLADMLDFHRRSRAQATIALTWVDNPGAFGAVETEPNGRVRRFVEKPSPGEVSTHWINAGIYILETELLRRVPLGRHYMFESGLFPRMLELGEPLYGYPSRGYWMDMGTPGKYLKLNCDLLASGAAGGAGEVICGADAVIHPSVRLTPPVLVGDDGRIDEVAVITGPVVIGDGCRIAAGATLERAVVWTGANIEAGAEIKDGIVIRDPDGRDQVIAAGS